MDEENAEEDEEEEEEDEEEEDEDDENEDLDPASNPDDLEEDGNGPAWNSVDWRIINIYFTLCASINSIEWNYKLFKSFLAMIVISTKYKYYFLILFFILTNTLSIIFHDMVNYYLILIWFIGDSISSNIIYAGIAS